VIVAAGGAVLVAAEVASVVLDESGGARGVRMVDGREFRAPVVISDAGAVQTLTRLLPPEVAGLPAGGEEIGPSLPWVVLNIGIRESGEALGLPQANIWAHAGPDIEGERAAFEADPGHRRMPLYFLSFPSVKDPLWEARYPGRATVDICGLTTWSLFEQYADTPWKHHGPGYDELKERLTAELLDQVFRFCPQLRGKVDHLELGTPLTFNHFLGRESGDFMSLAHTPTRFRQRWLGTRTSVPNLFLCGQDAAAAGVSGAMVGGVVAASAVLGRDVLADLPK
jgi:all-trans-retinol 13,14-reductase